MIQAADGEFHFKADSHWQWAETLAFPFSVPEANLNGIVYVLARPMLGVCMCDITIMDRISDLWEDQAYVDNQQHLPCPKSLLEFSLPNGLSLKAIEPVKHYEIRYEGIDDTRFTLDLSALHEPYDCNDPAMDPLAARRNGPAWDSAWSGHFEATYRIRGELVLRGQRHAVDCVNTGDRSWGQRAERDNGTMIWWNAAFGADLALHLFTRHDIAKTADFGSLVSGYVLENGQVHGITECHGRQEYRKAVPMGGRLAVTDVRGKSFDFTYSTVNSSYWAPYPSNTYLQSSMRVNHRGRIGYGIQQLGLSRAYLGRNREALLARY
ncbi:MAG TPA: hypothetical protein VLI72_17565 [Methylibium sp.]|nr:hypothetical protein [Methylibium sp.]